MDMKVEVVVLPVSDVDRATNFYTKLGWRVDANVVGDDGFRLVQMTPPGSPCSLQFGSGVAAMAPGSAHTTYLVVDDIEAARQEIADTGVAISSVYHCATGLACRFEDKDRATGPAPEHTSYGSFASFTDPDGNAWLLQEITTRLPGRGGDSP